MAKTFQSTRAVVLGVLTALTVVGCNEKGPGNPDAYQENSTNCSDAFVNEYNSVNTYIPGATIADAQAKVDAFNNRFRDVSCVAENRASGAKLNVSTNEYVAKWNSVINRARKQADADAAAQATTTVTAPATPPKPITPVAPVASDTSKPATEQKSKELGSAMRLEILDADRFNEFAKKESWIQSGNSVIESAIDRTHNVCYITSQSKTPNVKRNDIIDLNLKNQFGNERPSRFSGVQVNLQIGSYADVGDLGIGCSKFSTVANAYAKWTVSDVNEALTGIARVVE